MSTYTPKTFSRVFIKIVEDIVASNQTNEDLYKAHDALIFEMADLIGSFLSLSKNPSSALGNFVAGLAIALDGELEVMIAKAQLAKLQETAQADSKAH